MWFNSDIRRYEFDKMDFAMCGQLIEHKCGREWIKPVVFVGKSTARTGLRSDEVTFWQKYLPKNGKPSPADYSSVFALKFENHSKEVYNIFRFLGFPIKSPTAEDEKHALLYIKTHLTPAFPQDGCIVEQDKYIIVNLGIDSDDNDVQANGFILPYFFFHAYNFSSLP